MPYHQLTCVIGFELWQRLWHNTGFVQYHQLCVWEQLCAVTSALLKNGFLLWHQLRAVPSAYMCHRFWAVTTAMAQHRICAVPSVLCVRTALCCDIGFTKTDLWCGISFVPYRQLTCALGFELWQRLCHNAGFMPYHQLRVWERLCAVTSALHNISFALWHRLVLCHRLVTGVSYILLCHQLCAVTSAFYVSCHQLGAVPSALEGLVWGVGAA